MEVSTEQSAGHRLEDTKMECGDSSSPTEDQGMGSEHVCPIRPPQNLPDLIQQLHCVFSMDTVNVEHVKTLMSLYKSNYKEWKKFAKFDKHRYTRNLVDEGNGKFNLMLLCWNEAQGSSIHSHSNSHCFMKVLEGTVQEELFDWPTESCDQSEMCHMQVSKYKKNEVAYINDDLGLHRVENPSHTDRAITLHLYSPPFDSCKVFDQNTGHITTARVTFWSKFGQRTGPCVKTREEAENN